LGFGGVKVSETEKATLAHINWAYGVMGRAKARTWRARLLHHLARGSSHLLFHALRRYRLRIFANLKIELDEQHGRATTHHRCTNDPSLCLALLKAR
jgi:hypothetical protein